MKDETTNALAKAGLIDETALISAEAGEFDGPSGFEGVDNECITIPFLKMAQSGTDEAKKGSPKQIKGLEPGMFFCPATRKVYGEEVNLVILRFYRQYVIYESASSDAKFLGTMSPETFKSHVEPYATRERSYHLDGDGHRYVDTRNFIVLIPGHYDDGPMLLSLSSTGISPSRKWLTQAQNVRDSNGKVTPIWGNIWTLKTGYMDNDAGSYYQIAQIERLGFVASKHRPMVVAAFLDAQAAANADLERNYKGQADEPAGEPPMKQAEQHGEAAVPPAADAKDLF